MYFACNMLPIGSSALRKENERIEFGQRSTRDTHSWIENLQFGLNTEGSLVVCIDSCAIVRKNFLHSNIRMVDGVLAHSSSSDASTKQRFLQHKSRQIIQFATTYPCLIAKTLEYTINLLLFFSKDGLAVTQLEITVEQEEGA